MRWQLTILWLFFVSASATPVTRWRRQIVTPTHLMGPPAPPNSQSKVVVTPQKLKEVSHIRTAIQKAVDEDTYVVAAPPPQAFLTSLGGNSWPVVPISLPPLWPAPAINLLPIAWPMFG
ncbi:uncharacterized protein LOC108102129 [Drosophila ficusphila]|uniref:uncharacterized protein LOC108102129 n=1 Tax=Drosophila ficusphila TaxID=30025 RepID=UPI0007E6287D|nr:uncharacterized protein LOC108102129 [Drosophila ficusphila]